jgi:replicative DNA helicase
MNAGKQKANGTGLDTAFLERIPPQNLEAEMSLLGSMLIAQDVIPSVAEIVKVEDFYREAHQKIFQAIVSLYARGEPADPITTAEELNTMGVLDEIGEKSYLHTLISGVPTAANAKYYAEIIERNAILRSLIKVGTEVASLGYQAPEDIELTIDKAESLIFGISQKRISEKFVLIKELLTESFEQIEKLYEKRTHVTGISTGFVELDEITSGLHPSDLIIIASRPSMGKTSFALGIASNVALQHKVPVAVFSLEMSRQQLAQRLMCAEARVDAQSLRTGNLKEEDWPKLSSAVGKLAEASIYIDDTANITIMEVRAKARRLMARQKLGLIIVDYLQLMQGNGRSENRQQEISEISRALKILGRELNVPIIAISQLSRAVEQRQDKRPLLSDLRESGAIEQDADLVAFIYRDEYYHRDSDDKGIAEIIISKHRNGPTGIIRLAFLEHYTKFANLAKRM